MSIFSSIDEPSWPDILRAVQDQLQNRIHTAIPAIVRTYVPATQRAEVDIAVQTEFKIPPLADVPVVWPGGTNGFLHVPLSAGDSVLLVFTEIDFAKWDDTGSVSSPAVLQRHGLHAVAIPGLRPTTAPLAVTGGHVTLAGSEVRLGSDGAADSVALAPAVIDNYTQLKDALDALVTALDGLVPGTSVAWDAAMTGWPVQVAATKVRAE